MLIGTEIDCTVTYSVIVTVGISVVASNDEDAIQQAEDRLPNLWSDEFKLPQSWSKAGFSVMNSGSPQFEQVL